MGYPRPDETRLSGAQVQGCPCPICVWSIYFLEVLFFSVHLFGLFRVLLVEVPHSPQNSGWNLFCHMSLAGVTDAVGFGKSLSSLFPPGKGATIDFFFDILYSFNNNKCWSFSPRDFTSKKFRVFFFFSHVSGVLVPPIG